MDEDWSVWFRYIILLSTIMILCVAADSIFGSFRKESNEKNKKIEILIIKIKSLEEEIMELKEIVLEDIEWKKKSIRSHLTK